MGGAYSHVLSDRYRNFNKVFLMKITGQIMKTLNELNTKLFQTLERITDEEIDGEALDKELKRAKAVVDVSSVIINNAQTVLNAMKMMDVSGRNNKEMPEFLSCK